MIAQDIVKISNKPISIKYDATKPEGDLGRCADTNRALKRLGWIPKTPLSVGLEKPMNGLRIK